MHHHHHHLGADPSPIASRNWIIPFCRSASARKADAAEKDDCLNEQQSGGGCSEHGNRAQSGIIQRNRQVMGEWGNGVMGSWGGWVMYGIMGVPVLFLHIPSSIFPNSLLSVAPMPIARRASARALPLAPPMKPLTRGLSLPPINKDESPRRLAPLM